MAPGALLGKPLVLRSPALKKLRGQFKIMWPEHKHAGGSKGLGAFWKIYTQYLKTRLLTTREALCIFTYVQICIILKIRFCIGLFEIRYLCFLNIIKCTYIIFLVENHRDIMIYLRDIKLICT